MWWWVLTRPGVTRQPRRSSTSSAWSAKSARSAAGPMASMRWPRMNTDASLSSRRCSSKVATQRALRSSRVLLMTGLGQRSGGGGGTGLEPGADQGALLVGDAGGIVHGHDLGDHRLLVDRLGMGLDLLGRIQAHVLHLHGLTVAHVAARRQHLLHLGIADGGRRGRRWR